MARGVRARGRRPSGGCSGSAPQQSALNGYLRRSIGGAAGECLLIFYCTAQGRLFAGELIAASPGRMVGANAAALLSRARMHGASGVVLAHNHPSSACYPSSADIAATVRLRMLARRHGIALVDHLIVTRDAVFSMREGRIW